jgi:hypothetical protein
VIDFLSKNIQKIRAGVEHHNLTCKVPARAILFNPSEYERLGVLSLWGLPLRSDQRQRRGYFRVDCEGSAWQLESELAAHIEFATTAEMARVRPE